MQVLLDPHPFLLFGQFFNCPVELFIYASVVWLCPDACVACKDEGEDIVVNQFFGVQAWTIVICGCQVGG
jgi:hypothetical protein